jgi:hypothetical protein
MEILVLVGLIALLLVRWVYLRDRLDEIDQRINALAAAVSAAPAAAQPGRVPVMGRVPVAMPTPAAAPPPAQAQSEVVTPAAAVAAPAPAFPTPATPSTTAPAATVAPSAAPPLQPPSAPVAPESPRPLLAPSAFPTPAPLPPPAPFAPEPRRPLPPPPAFTTPATPQRSSEEWEAILGGNWLNKIGVFVLVIGIALALAYSYKLLGPAGRVAVSVAISLAMLAGGVAIERRERYRIFARGLIGGGWAALYFTVYAMQALEAARIIRNDWVGAFLLLAVAVGMIVHSLRYRSQTVTGLGYFIAFVTLAITEVTALSLIALIPLAASLLYIARRFGWSRMALFGLIATYVTCATRPDNGAPLWQAQTIFAIYWLLFEAFDILCADPWLLPLNALGFLGLSIYKQEAVAPHQLWLFLAASAAAYLAGAILRARAGRWHAAITLTAALAGVAMFLKLDHQWIALGLLVEAELFYLAGVRLRAGYLRTLAAALFGVELAQMFAVEVGQAPVRAWTPIAALNAVAFYGNRALRSADIFYGFAAAGMVALVAGFETPEPYRAMIWLLLALAPFALGWWRRLADFRLQGYLLMVLGLTGAAMDLSRLSLAIAAAVSYGLTLCALLSGEDRLVEDERDAVRFAGSLAATMSLAALIWRVVPGEYLGVSWMAMALLLLELGLRGMPKYLCRQSYALAIAGVLRVAFFNLPALVNHGAWEPRLAPAATALLAYAMAARARKEEGGAVLGVASVVGTAFGMAALWALLPNYAVAPAWAALALILAEFDVPVLRMQTHLVSLAAVAGTLAVNLEAPYRVPAMAWVPLSHYYLWWRTRERFYLYTAAGVATLLMHFDIGRTYASAGWAAFGLALLYAGRRWQIQDLCWQSYALAALAFGRCWYINFDGAAAPLAAGAMVLACLYAAQMLSERAGQARLYYCLLATTLTSLLPYYQVAGSLRTVVWGMEGVALLGSGFPLRDRVLRLCGLALLLGCILKLFVWDLRHLETGPRILSFIVLGLFLVGVSWVYTRFRERVAQYL